MSFEASNTSIKKNASPAGVVQENTAQTEVIQKEGAKPNRNSLWVQPKLTVGAPDDPYEKEADAVADKVMRMPEPAFVEHKTSGFGPQKLQRKTEEEETLVQPKRNGSDSFIQKKCVECEKEEGEIHRKPISRTANPLLQSKSGSHATVSDGIAHTVQSSRGSGSILDGQTQSFMSNRFGRDFSSVKIHTDVQAVRMNRDLNAKAFTVGNDVYFNQGQYQPGSSKGKHLLAHELTHVVQQANGQGSSIQRECSNSDFCKPYATTAEADSAEWWIRNTYLRAEGVETFGSDVKSMYESFLDRSPGDSLAPRVFDDDEGYVVSSFKSSWDTKDDMDNVIDLIGSRLNRAPSGSISNRRSLMSLSNFLSESEMNNRPINYSNPLSVAGHIAGGIGSSAAGDDYRKITSANVALEKTTLVGNTGYISVELIPHYEVFDAIDFCPGDCGSPAEQLITVPMSRLEASGAAYDVPFKVIFIPDNRSKRFWF